MEILKSSLYREVDKVVNSGSKPVHFSYTATIHANNTNYNVLKILNIDLLEDYELNYSDEILLTVVIEGGTYAKRIYPYKGNLDITITKRPLNESGDITDDESSTQTERFTAVILDTGNPMVEGNVSATGDEEAMNLSNIFEITFQLVNKALEKLRLVTVGGIYRYATVENVVKTIMTNESKNIKIDSSRIPIGVDMVPASNQTTKDHIILPHGTKLVDVPEYVHRTICGIYSAGLGYYYKNDHWYIYPCYDNTRFSKAKRTMTIINVPKNKLPEIERTYRVDGNNIVIIATGDVKHNDDSDVQQLNYGNGVRFAEADNFLDDFSTTENNKTKVKRGKNNTEVISDIRDNGKNNVQVSSNPITSNPYLEYSKLARRQGNYLSLVWENSLPTLLMPGMMAKVIYMYGDDIKEVYGTLLKAHHFISTKSKTLINSRHVTNSALVLFAQKIKE